LKDNIKNKNSESEQLEKYAKDFAELYKSEKAKSNELKTAYKQLIKYADALNKTNRELKKKNRLLNESTLDTIHRLVLAAEFKDNETANHIVRISRYSRCLAEKIGLSPSDIKNIYYTAPMHDIGKIGIPDSILIKPGKLTSKEYRSMKTHPLKGAEILNNSRYKILQIAHEIALSHHEKWNGNGYPKGLSGKKIPLFGRIVGLADVFDALTSRRPYKKAYPVEVAYDIIKKESGAHFDPEITIMFLDSIDDIVLIKNEVNSEDMVSLADFTWSDRDKKNK